MAGHFTGLIPVGQNKVVERGAIPGAGPEFRFIADRAALPLPEDLVAVDDAVGLFSGNLVVMLDDTSRLETLIKKLKSVKGVKNVTRI